MKKNRVVIQHCRWKGGISGFSVIVVKVAGKDITEEVILTKI